MKTMTKAEFQAACKAQGVPGVHIAVKCPICATVQSLVDLKRAAAGASPQHMLDYFGAATVDVHSHHGYSCFGRFSNAGGHVKGTPPGRGCSWTLGGFLQVHHLEVVDDEGRRHPFFDLATPLEAQLHMLTKQQPDGAYAECHGFGEAA